MVYYIGSLRKIIFNRNILYCKLLEGDNIVLITENLIETFCIVNDGEDNKFLILHVI